MPWCDVAVNGSWGGAVGYEQIRYAVDGPVATVSLHRPERRNGYTALMADELAAAFQVADDDESVRAVVLTGTGADFCVGADLAGGGLTALTEEVGADWREPAGRCALRIFALSKPVIAAIRGAAVGAGSTIVLPCDYRIAGTDARFGYVFTRRGIVPEGASAWFLPRLVGLGTALDWMVSGRIVESGEALRRGLVHELHDPESVLDRAYELALELAETTAPVAVAVTRQLLYRMSALDSPYPLDALDSRLILDGVAGPDAAEGVASFFERRAPDFPGRVPKDLPPYLPWRDGRG
jgi:enoyl-CoA hydratase/carnithine racemase